MNLYRLDIQNPDGTETPVSDLLGTRLIRQHATACVTGRQVAATVGRPVKMTRISGAGSLKVMRTFENRGAIR